MKSTSYFRSMPNKGKQNLQYEILKEEYERTDVLDDRKIKIRVREVRLEKLRREIEEINKFNAKRQRLNQVARPLSKKDERIEKYKESIDLGQYFSMRNCNLRKEPKPTNTNAVYINGPSNNGNSLVLALSENVHFIDLETAANQKLETCGNCDTHPKITEKSNRIVNKWHKLAVCLTGNSNLCAPIYKQTKSQESSLNSSNTVVNDNGSHQPRNERLNNRHTLQTENEDDEFSSHCLLKPSLGPINNNQNQLTKPIERNDFNNFYGTDVKQGSNTFGVGKLRKIFEHDNH